MQVLYENFQKSSVASSFAKKQAFERFCQTGTLVAVYHCCPDGTATKYTCSGLKTYTQKLQFWPKEKFPEFKLDKNSVIEVY